MTRMRRTGTMLVAAAVAAACGFNPNGPFDGFDGQGSRLRGSFASDAPVAKGAAPAAAFEGIRVSVRERPSLSTAVGGDGRFLVVGVPTGAWTLLFERDGRPLGETRFQGVRSNQEIRIVVAITGAGEVILMEESRDQVSFGEGECPRGPGFWCQNQDGNNPNLSAAEFDEFSTEAAALLSAVEALNTKEEVAAAVCNTGDQLLRHLATLALNLAAGTLTRDTPLLGEPDYPTVGAAFDAAVQAASTGAGRADRNRIKDVLDRINNNQNTAACEDGTPDDENVPGPGGPGQPPTPNSGQVTICHIPPGNPANRRTLTVGASAVPAHLAHGDFVGPCS
jgi:hypothetical protein